MMPSGQRAPPPAPGKGPFFEIAEIRGPKFPGKQYQKIIAAARTGQPSPPRRFNGRQETMNPSAGS